MNMNQRIDRKSFVPIYRQLADIIEKQILSGTIREGDKIPSETELTKLYGIGRLTVREAINYLLREGYLEKFQGKGTFCLGIPAKKNLNVDVMLDMMDTYFIPNYVKSISHLLSLHNANFIISDTKDSDFEICNLIESVIKKGSSGVILQPIHGIQVQDDLVQATFKKLNDAGIPCVMIDSFYDNINASYLVLDEKLGGSIAAEHLISHNHTKVGVVYVGGFKDSMLRVNGFVTKYSQLPDYDLHDITLIEYKDNFSSALEATVLSQNPPTALFCYNDEVALICMQILSKLGILVPAQISIVGFDDSVLAPTANPALTTIAHPKGDIGKDAVEILFKIINKEISENYTKIYKPFLVERNSCRTI